jgi:NADPH:quinone reductase-like Zn-dependent oxidoreductase
VNLVMAEGWRARRDLAQRTLAASRGGGETKAAVLRAVKQPLTIEDVEVSKPGPHEVLLRTAAAGVCHSDLHFQNGSYFYPMLAVLGHVVGRRDRAGRLNLDDLGLEAHLARAGERGLRRPREGSVARGVIVFD